MKKYIVVLVVLSMAVMTTPAFANYSCAGPITYIGTQSDGSLVVGGPGGLPDVYLCSMGAPSANGYSAEGCKAAYAQLLSSYLSGKNVTIFLGNDGLTCSTQTPWTLVDVYFVSSN